MKKKILLTILWIFILISLLTLFINVYMIKGTEKQIIELNSVENLQNIDAILILGCKAYSYGPSEMLAKRLDKGIEVYNILNKKILLSGDHGTNNYDEVNVMRDYILNSNINSSDVFLDHAGFNTYDSIYRAKYIFNAKRIIIITQNYHMSRALYIANKLGIESYGVIAEDIPYKGIMIRNELREILSRDKNFFKVIFKPQSKYLGEVISLDGDGNITNG